MTRPNPADPLLTRATLLMRLRPDAPAREVAWREFKRRFNQRLRFGGRSLDTIDAGELQIEAVWNDIWEAEKLQRALELVRQRYLSRPDRAKTYRAFEMCALIEREPAEVAVELGMSVDGVHQAKTRISKALRAAMEELEDFVV